MAGRIPGTRVERKEDPKCPTTGGVYVDDLTEEVLSDALHVVYARSAVAHGTILWINIDGAEDMPGVVGVFTADSLALEPVPSSYSPIVARTLLASDKVRWVGEPVVASSTSCTMPGRSRTTRPASRWTGSRSSGATPIWCPEGGGTMGSRSLQAGVSAVNKASIELASHRHARHR